MLSLINKLTKDGRIHRLIVQAEACLADRSRLDWFGKAYDLRMEIWHEAVDEAVRSHEYAGQLRADVGVVVLAQDGAIGRTEKAKDLAVIDMAIAQGRILADQDDHGEYARELSRLYDGAAGDRR